MKAVYEYNQDRLSFPIYGPTLLKIREVLGFNVSRMAKAFKISTHSLNHLEWAFDNEMYYNKPSLYIYTKICDYLEQLDNATMLDIVLAVKPIHLLIIPCPGYSNPYKCAVRFPSTVTVQRNSALQRMEQSISTVCDESPKILSGKEIESTEHQPEKPKQQEGPFKIYVDVYIDHVVVIEIDGVTFNDLPIEIKQIDANRCYIVTKMDRTMIEKLEFSKYVNSNAWVFSIKPGDKLDKGVFVDIVEIIDNTNLHCQERQRKIDEFDFSKYQALSQ